ncbi:MAG: MFS transporter [Candidatus Thiodiazotropha sp.]
MNRESVETSWLAVWAAVGCGIGGAINVGKVPMAMDLLRQEFGLSLVTAGWVASMLSTLAVFSALFIGVVCDRIGHLRMTGIGLAVSIAATLAGLLVHDSGGLLLTRFGEGVGFLIVVIAAPGLVSTAANSADRRFALGIWATYLPTGVGLTMLVAPILLPLWGWRSLWWLSIVCLAIAGLAIYRLRQAYAGHPADSPHSMSDVTSAVLDLMPWLLGIVFCCWAIQYFALIVWLPTFLEEQYDLSQGMVGLLCTAVVFVHAPGNLVGGALVKHHYRRGTLIVFAGIVTTLLSCVVYLDLLPDPLRYLACLTLSFSGGLISASVLSSTEALAKTRRQIGTLQGLFIQCAHLGQFIGPPLIALLVSRSGLWQDALWVTGTAAGFSILLGMAIHRREGRSLLAAGS